GSPEKFSLEITRYNDPVSLPLILPSGYDSSGLKVKITCISTISSVRDTLRVVSNDPDTPVAMYRISRDAQAEIQGAFERILIVLAGGTPHASGEAAAQ